MRVLKFKNLYENFGFRFFKPNTMGFNEIEITVFKKGLRFLWSI